jgi:hypothetical protein
LIPCVFLLELHRAFIWDKGSGQVIHDWEDVWEAMGLDFGFFPGKSRYKHGTAFPGLPKVYTVSGKSRYKHGAAFPGLPKVTVPLGTGPRRYRR